MLAGKKILLAVCGSIAAYKTAFFVRLLVKSGAEVRVVMTHSATDFIAPLTLSTLSKNPVHLDFYDKNTGQWENHVELGLWADLVVIAPASANTLAKLAHGICDNLLTATYLSARCPVMIAPAMDLDMYRHAATCANIETLRTYGNKIIEARDGELASGLSGIGRMAEPEELLEIVARHFQTTGILDGKHVMITSGPTHEPMDAVRFIGNHSSGKMGKALALACAQSGATVTFISGPTANLPEHSAIHVIQVTTALEMFEAAKQTFPSSDIGIFAAAVADYRPKERSDKKKKRDGSNFTIELVENPDIALEMGKQKTHHQLTVGFALESHQEEEFAREKLKKKNFDLVVMNSLQDKGAGFAHDTNKITVYDTANNAFPFELKTKEAVARDILNLIVRKLNA